MSPGSEKQPASRTQSSESELGTAPVGSLLLKLAIPTITVQLINMVNTRLQVAGLEAARRQARLRGN